MVGWWRRAWPLIAWMAALLVGLAVFHGLGSGPMAAPPLTDPSSWGGWAADRDPLVVTVAVLRLLVLALAWYLVGVTAIGLAARLLRAARLVRLADALTLPLVRRLLQSALGVGLATAMVGAATAPVPGGSQADLDPAGAPQTAMTLAAVDPGADESAPVSMRLLEQERSPADRGDVREASMRPRPATGEAAMRAVGHEAEPSQGHRVVPGESLWSIAQDALAHRWDREPTDAEVHAYWREVIDANAEVLPDPDNPDLIFPGDQVRLPPSASGP